MALILAGRDDGQGYAGIKPQDANNINGQPSFNKFCLAF